MQLNHQRDILTWQLVNPSGYHPKKKKEHPLIDYLKWLLGIKKGERRCK